MNREILFKAKHTHVKPKNKHLDGRWIEGYLASEDYINSPELKGEFFIDKNTVCQYINYTDLRKKKVFEHDIIFCENNGHYGQVVFKEGKYLIDWGDDGDYLRTDVDFWFTYRRMYVVGNIFVNPELLED